MASKTRIYIVKHHRDGGGKHLVRASSQAQALRHIVEEAYTCEVASQDDLVKAVAEGVKVVDAKE